MSSNPPAIRVSHLSKQYKLGGPQEPYQTLRDTIVDSLKAPFKAFHRNPPKEGFWALKNVSFDVNQGEVVGIIGRNGAGKSTLLKILSRITSPTEGIIELHGRVGSLLEVGTGFHQELTGRENIFLSGSILGMKKSEIQEKFDEIVKFAEIKTFIDTPVKRYSSGMYVRLAFAVAAYLDPEILIVDEVLAVGDIAFQKKCLGKMGEIAKGGRTVLFVSHNMGAIRSLCGSAIWLDNGQIVKEGASDEVVRSYEESQTNHLNATPYIIERSPDDMKRFKFYVSRIEMQNTLGKNSNIFRYNEKIILIVDFAGDLAGSRFSSEFRIYNDMGQLLTVGASGAYYSIYFNENVRKVRIEIGPLPLTSGDYRIFLSIMAGNDRVDTWENAISFTIIDCQPYTKSHNISATNEGVFIIGQSFSEVQL
jgi:lipopolysaccharide transport system ATP-binding protein